MKVNTLAALSLNAGESKERACSNNKLSKGQRESLTFGVPLQEDWLLVKVCFFMHGLLQSLEECTKNDRFWLRGYSFPGQGGKCLFQSPYSGRFK